MTSHLGLGSEYFLEGFERLHIEFDELAQEVKAAL